MQKLSGFHGHTLTYTHTQIHTAIQPHSHILSFNTKEYSTTEQPSPLTRGQLHPGADLVNAAGVEEEEEDAADHQQHGDPHEEHGRLEGPGRDGTEVQGTSFADELIGEGVANAVVEEAEVAGLGGVDAVAYPVGLDENHHCDDRECDGEHDPQHANGACVTHIVGVVDLGGFLGGEHGWYCLLTKRR